MDGEGYEEWMERVTRNGSRVNKTIPCIKTKHLPGPKGRKIMDTDIRYISQSYTRTYPLVVKEARGDVVTDVDGNRFLDFTAGIAVNSTGHCHPQVVRAIQQQAAKLIHMSGTDFYYQVESDLAKKLAHITPGKMAKKVFFTNSGAESVEAAFKLARYATKRQRMISFIGGFHGRTLGALSLTASKIQQIKHFSPLVPEVYHVEYGYCFRCPYHLKYPSCDISCVKYIEEEIFHKIVPPEEVAGLIVEPIQGEGGYVVPPPEYHPMLKKLCEKYGILYIADEVQTGMGRTGKMFALEHWGVVPDIMCLAKGIASGMPLGAMVAKESVMVWERGSHASTFGGNPVSCAAALKTIELLEGGLVRNAAVQGAYLMDKLRAFQKESRIIGDVRGRGLMIGVEIVESPDTLHIAPKRRDWIIQKCFEKGLLLLGAGDSAVRLCPPLMISRKSCDTALEILTATMKRCEKEKIHA